MIQELFIYICIAAFAFVGRVGREDEMKKSKNLMILLQVIFSTAGAAFALSYDYKIVNVTMDFPFNHEENRDTTIYT